MGVKHLIVGHRE